jgi:hypothetical protein
VRFVVKKVVYWTGLTGLGMEKKGFFGGDGFSRRLLDGCLEKILNHEISEILEKGRSGSVRTIRPGG